MVIRVRLNEQLTHRPPGNSPIQSTVQTPFVTYSMKISESGLAFFGFEKFGDKKQFGSTQRAGCIRGIFREIKAETRFGGIRGELPTA
jgi:hypothetical protein